MDCVVEVNLPSVVVRKDAVEIDQLIQSLQSSTYAPNSSPLVQILSSGNQNAVGQVLTSLSQHFNGINTQVLQTAADSEFYSREALMTHFRSPLLEGGVPLWSVSVSTLSTLAQPTVSDDGFSYA